MDWREEASISGQDTTVKLFPKENLVKKRPESLILATTVHKALACHKGVEFWPEMGLKWPEQSLVFGTKFRGFNEQTFIQQTESITLTSGK